MNQRTAKTLAAMLLAALPAAAQTTQPGRLGEERIRIREQVMSQRQSARWKVGPLELDPSLGVSDLGYVSNIFFSVEGESLSDFRARPSASLRGFLNLGPKLLMSPFVNLDYSWWLEQEELRSLNESFGLQLFGDFNRLRLQLQAGRVEKQQNLNSEVQVPVDRRNDRIDFDFELEFWRPFRLFANVSDGRLRHFGAVAEQQVPGLDLGRLDADTQRLRGGLAYERGDGLFVALGVEETDIEYLRDPARRSYRGSGPVFRLAYEGARLQLDFDVAVLDLSFSGREGPERRQDSGFAQIGWRFTEKLTARLYGGAELSASALDQEAIFEGRRTGLSLHHAASSRTRLRAFYEVGEDEFATISSDRLQRIDDLTSFGASLLFDLTSRLTIELGFFDTRRDSSDPDFDRDLRSINSRIRFGSDLLPW